MIDLGLLSRTLKVLALLTLLLFLRRELQGHILHALRRLVDPRADPILDPVDLTGALIVGVLLGLLLVVPKESPG
jgi:hypothetical protein